MAIEEARWLVAGLGNPGSAYAHTRHNVGFAVLERLAEQGSARFAAATGETQVALVRLSSIRVLLLKPQTFMNRSGAAVAGWLSHLALSPADLVVVHDDLDLSLGRLRIVTGAGAGGHRGVRSIQEALGTQDFARVRVGIGRPQVGEAASDRVLSDFAPEEVAVLDHSVTRAVEAVRSVILEGAAPAMNRYNVRPRPGSDPGQDVADEPVDAP